MFGKSNKASHGATARVDLGKVDDLGPYPADIDDNPTRDRVHDRALRSVSIVAIVSGMINIALIMLIIAILPLQRIYPFLVTFKSQDNQVVNVQPLETNAAGIDFMTEENVRDYVAQRHNFTPIQTVMDGQWGKKSKLAARTSEELYAVFAEKSKIELTQMMTAGYTRNVTVNSVNKIGDDTWQVAFTTTDTVTGAGGTLTANPEFGSAPAAGAPPVSGTPVILSVPTSSAAAPASTAQWVATMKIVYLPQKVKYDSRLLNPLGFTVTDYSVSRRS